MDELNQRTLEIGTELLERAHRAEPRFYQPAWWEQQIMNWTIKDDWLKTQLFRFVEVLPSLQDDTDIAEHLKLYLERFLSPLSASPDGLRRDKSGLFMFIWP